MKITIDKVWVEFEYITPQCCLDDYISEQRIPYSSFTEFQEWILEWYKCKYSKEYYNEMCELNVWWTDKENLVDLTNKLKSKVDDELLKIEWVSPSFVWTHMHLLLNRWKEKIQNKMIRRRLFLISRIYTLLMDEFMKLIKEWKFEKNRNMFIKTMRRLTWNHNLLINFDKNTMDYWIKKQLLTYWRNYCYTNWQDNKKFQPIIWSQKVWSKPFSLELRMISNTLIMEDGNEDLMKRIVELTEKLLNVKMKDINNDAEEVNLLIQHHKMCHTIYLLESMYDNLSDKHIKAIEDIDEKSVNISTNKKNQYKKEFLGIEVEDEPEEVPNITSYILRNGSLIPNLEEIHTLDQSMIEEYIEEQVDKWRIHNAVIDPENKLNDTQRYNVDKRRKERRKTMISMIINSWEIMEEDLEWLTAEEVEAIENRFNN